MAVIDLPGSVILNWYFSLLHRASRKEYGIMLRPPVNHPIKPNTNAFSSHRDIGPENQGFRQNPSPPAFLNVRNHEMYYERPVEKSVPPAAIPGLSRVTDFSPVSASASAII